MRGGPWDSLFNDRLCGRPRYKLLWGTNKISVRLESIERGEMAGNGRWFNGHLFPTSGVRFGEGFGH